MMEARVMWLTIVATIAGEADISNGIIAAETNQLNTVQLLERTTTALALKSLPVKPMELATEGEDALAAESVSRGELKPVACSLSITRTKRDV